MKRSRLVITILQFAQVIAVTIAAILLIGAMRTMFSLL